jgi:beta-lactamase regulating signal transducer with metallopeptidase domain
MFAAALPSIWLIGGAVYLVWTMLIHGRFCRRLKRVAACDDPRLIGLWDACRQQAGVRRHIPILPFDDVPQPAVLGLFRPKLLLPTAATDLTDEQLRMVMLHELAHVRRWDIAANWLLVVLRALHWWNPVYWLAAARFQSLREQSCDAFALRRIEGQPVRGYSELLLTLAQRQTAGSRWRIRLPVSMLGFVSSFFRKRAVGNRLKALRTAGVTRSRWHTAAVAALVGVVSVCGLTDASTPEPPPDRSTVWESRPSHVWDWDAAPRVARSYDLEKALTRIAVDARTKDQARVELTSLLTFLLKGINGKDPELASWLSLAGRTLTLTAPANVQAEAARLLNAWEQAGQGQICAELRLITDERDIASTIGVAWRYLDAFASDRAADLSAEAKSGTPLVRARASVGENLPVAVAVLDARQVQALTQAVQGLRWASTSQSMKATTFNGQPASLFNGTQRPFVVGTQAATAGAPQPKIALVDEGLQLTYRATQTSTAKQVQLEAQVELSEIGAVRTAAMLLPGEPQSIQLPRVTRSRIDVSTEVREGQTLLIGCVPTQQQQEFHYVLLTVHHVWTDSELR